jgi:predicted alpha-1,6-mannanase (GH76 family)
MEHYFPGTAWLRLDKDRFDRLAAYKSRHALARWEDVVDTLLDEDEA